MIINLHFIEIFRTDRCYYLFFIYNGNINIKFDNGVVIFYHKWRSTQ